MNQPYVDTHCHLLPSLDDGPPSVTASIRMARSLVAGGAHTVVCTPHFSRRFPVSIGAARSAFAFLRDALETLDVPLALALAAEVSARVALGAAPDDLFGRRLGGAHLLVELESASSPAEVDAVLSRLDAIGLVPVLAHPERCIAVQRGLGRVAEWKQAGALVQVVAPSLIGGSDSATSHVAWELLESGLADVVASDGHRAGSGRLRLHEVADMIATRCGEDAADRLMVRRPLELIEPKAEHDA